VYHAREKSQEKTFMPMGPAPLGLAYFAAVKLAGYTAYCGYLRKRYEEGVPHDWPRTLILGGVRTLIGVGVGALYGVIAWKGLFGESAGPVFLAGLIPVRIAEWLFLLWIAFGEKIRERKRTAWATGWGIAVSYALDAIGIAAAFVIPGGFWVC
jgi:hypothetical protein